MWTVIPRLVGRSWVRLVTVRTVGHRYGRARARAARTPTVHTTDMTSALREPRSLMPASAPTARPDRARATVVGPLAWKTKESVHSLAVSIRSWLRTHISRCSTTSTPVPTVTSAAGTASFTASQRAGETDWVHASCAVPVSISRPISEAPAQAATRNGRKVSAREAYREYDLYLRIASWS